MIYNEITNIVNIIKVIINKTFLKIQNKYLLYKRKILWPDNSRNIGDFVEEIKFSLIEGKRSTLHLSFDHCDEVLQLFTKVHYCHKMRDRYYIM